MRRLATLVALVAALCAVGQGPATADDGGASWQVRPSPEGGASRAAFELSLSPGATAQDAVVVTNLGSEPLALSAFAEDIVTTSTGAVTLATEDAAGGASPWVALATDRLDVAAGASAELAFTVAPPANAEPGDYAVAVVTSIDQEVSGSAGQTAMLETRVGARIYLRVLGDLRSRVEITDVDVARDAAWWDPLPARTSTDFVVHNTGNVRLDTSATVTLEGPFGWRLGESAPRDLAQLLPGDTLRVSDTTDAETGSAGGVVVDGIVAPFVLMSTVRITATEVSTGQVFEYTASTSTPQIPWTVLALLVLSLGLGLVARRRRRADAAPGAHAHRT